MSAAAERAPSPRRKPLVAANWKMHTTPTQARELAAAVADAIPAADSEAVEVVICPPAICLPAVHEALSGHLHLGAQNMHWHDHGAFTGEIAPAMVAELCRYVILGHSERRQHFGETDAMVAHKVVAALAHRLVPLVCVGESLEQRTFGQTEAWITLQVRGALHGLQPEQLARIVVAYEPIWAIGTGQAATGEQAEAVAVQIRSVLGELAGEDVADGIRILYGGSVGAQNAGEFVGQPQIDGALVGGASLRPTEFAGIVRAAARLP